MPRAEPRARGQPRPAARDEDGQAPPVDVQHLANSIANAFASREKYTIEPYTGEGDIESWVDEYERQAKVHGWLEQHHVRYLRGHLKDVALVWYKANEKQEEIGDTSWPSLKEKLIKAFKSPTHELDQRQQLYKKRSSKDNLIMFAEKRRLLGIELGMPEKDIIANIISSMDGPTYSKLAKKDYQTFDELRIKLRYLAKEEVRDNKTHNMPSEPKNGRPAEKAVQCHYCNKLGHFKKECRSRIRDEEGQANHDRNKYRWTNKNQGAARGGNRWKQPDGQAQRMLPIPTKAGDNNKVQTIKPYPPVIVCILLNTEKVLAVFDTGAMLTNIDLDFYISLFGSEQLEPVGLEGRRLVGAGNNTLDCQYQADVSIKFWDAKDRYISDSVTAVLVNNLGSSVLVGMDFISKIGGLICLETGTSPTANSIRNCHVSFQPPPEHQPPLERQSATTMPKPEVSRRALKRRRREERKALEENSLQADVQRERHEGDENGGDKNEMTVGDSLEDVMQLGETGARGLGQQEAESAARIMAAKLDEQLTYEGQWGQLWEMPKDGFADDPTEERTNPYILEERTKSAPLREYSVNVGVELDDGATASIINMLDERYEMFAFEGQLGDCSIIEHEIRTGEAKPINVAPQMRARKEREAVLEQMNTWLSQGLIRPSMSPWASRMVTVLKKDGSLRCCVDYRALNKVTERDVYPLPTCQEILNCLEGMCYFSSLDLNQGYLQIRVKEEDIPKTAFVVQGNFYEFTHMSYGLTNAPATFQRLIDTVLAGLKWKACFGYLDDIIIYGRTLAEHNNNVSNVLGRLREAGLTLKPQKCAFGVTELKFLGHFISAEGVRMDPEKIRAVCEVTEIKSVDKIRRFIGLASYYRAFVENFSKIAEPLTRLTKKDVPFEWTADQEEAFNELKRRLTMEPVLCHFDESLPIELRIDACGYGLGAILLHVFPDGSRRVIAYASRLLVAAELNYGITEKEGLAMVWAIADKFRMYLQGVEFTVVTDHQALTWLQSKKDLTGRLMRWANKLQPYRFKVYYKSGKQHHDADFLSRCFSQVKLEDDQLEGGSEQDQMINKITISKQIEEIQQEPIDVPSILQAQKEDDECCNVTNKLNEHPDYIVEDDLLMFIDMDDPVMPGTLKPVIPKSILEETLGRLVDVASVSIRKAKREFKRRYFTRHCSTNMSRIIQKSRGGNAPTPRPEDVLTLRINAITYGRRGTYNRNQQFLQPSGPITTTTTDLSRERIREEQQNDTYCQEIYQNMNGTTPYALEDGLIVRLDNTGITRAQIVVPESLFMDVLKAMHDNPTSGHSGYRKTLWRFRQRYYIQRDSSRIKNYVQTCHDCQTRKPAWTRKWGMLHPLELARTPFERIGVDTLGPFRRSASGNEKVVVITDYMTKFAIAKPIRRENAEHLADVLVNEVFLVHGAPQTILTDQGKSFRTALMRQIYASFDVRHVTTTAYHPQTNGLTERLNRTIGMMLSMYVNNRQNDWDIFLPYILFAYNTTVQDSTGYSPHYLLYGREARLVTDVLDPNPEENISEHYQRLHQAREMAIQASGRAQVAQAQQYNKNRYSQEFKTGDLVLVYRPRGYIGQTTKLRHPYEGPCKVVQTYSDLNYLVRDISGTRRPKEEVVHVSRLKPYHMRETGNDSTTAAGGHSRQVDGQLYSET